MPKTVAVFFGGNSNEREISVITGMLAVNLLRSTPYRVVPVYLLPEGGMATGDLTGPADFKKGAKTPLQPVRLEGAALVRCKGRRRPVGIDCALNCCHGGMGEDGTLAALLRYHGIPSASPEAPMSAVCMDKTLSKAMARGLGIRVARGFTVTETAWKERAFILQQAVEFGYPVIVKPARLGSSIGIKVARNAEELIRALELAFRLDDRVLIEEYFEDKRDVNCAVYLRHGSPVLSPLEEVFSQEEILSFAEKYTSSPARRSQIPADLPEDLAEEIRAATLRLYETFGGRGVVRADFLLAGGTVYFNELNTVPGSLACYLFGGSLIENRALLVALVEEALNAPHSAKETLVSGILEGNLFSGKKGGR